MPFPLVIAAVAVTGCLTIGVIQWTQERRFEKRLRQLRRDGEREDRLHKILQG